LLRTSQVDRTSGGCARAKSAFGNALPTATTLAARLVCGLWP